MEGLSDSSLQMEMRGSQSTRIRKESLSLAQVPENMCTQGGKQPSHSDSKVVAYSTCTTKGDEMQTASLSSQPIDHEARTRQTNTTAQTSPNDSAGTSES